MTRPPKYCTQKWFPKIQSCYQVFTKSVKSKSQTTSTFLPNNSTNYK